MPVLTFDSLDEVIRNVNAMPHPLALYLFTSSKAAAKKLPRGADSEADASMIRSSILRQQKWDSADSARAAWALTMERPALIHLPTIRASWIKRPGSIFPCAISPTGKCTRKWCGFPEIRDPYFTSTSSIRKFSSFPAISWFASNVMVVSSLAVTLTGKGCPN